MIVLVPDGQKLSDPSIKANLEAELARIEELPGVNGTQSPFSTYLEDMVNPSETAGIAMIRLKGDTGEISDELAQALLDSGDRLEQLLPAGSRVRVGGEVFNKQLPKLSAAEVLGVAVALVILYIALGSILAAGIPLVTAIVGVGTATAILRGSTGVYEVSSTTPILALMLGLAVGIDYALFILSRHRNQLATGMDVDESIARAIATSGSAVVFAGSTVVISLLGLFVAGLPFLTIMGVFAAIAVAIAVVVAITLLPALMSVLGERLRPRKSRRRRRQHRSGRQRALSAKWINVVVKHPWITVLSVTILLALLAVPALNMHLSLPNAAQMSNDKPARQAYDLITEEMGPGYNGPLLVTTSLLTTNDPLGTLESLKAEILKVPNVKTVTAALPNKNADTGMLQIIPETAPIDPATRKLVEDLRALEGDWEREYGVATAVTGFTALALDVAERLKGALLPFGIFVVGLSLVLLASVFRSVAIPIKAVIGYLFSVGAAFGTTTLVFNEGWGKELINLDETTTIISFFPIICMGLLFGLAMDYEVFLVSRMREEHLHSEPGKDAIINGFVHSAPVVTSAGLIMVSVFSFFVPQGEGPIKAIAFGLAVGTAVDAFLIRMTWVPAVMTILGERAWWLPVFLDRILPQVDVEGSRVARQLELRDWPWPGADHAAYAEEFTVPRNGGIMFNPVDLEIFSGSVVCFVGPSGPRRAALLGLSGRLEGIKGKARVVGQLLPYEARAVRQRSVAVSGTNPLWRKHIAHGKPELVMLDQVDLMDRQSAQHLLRKLAEPNHPTYILGATEVPGFIAPDDVIRIERASKPWVGIQEVQNA